MNYFGNQPQNQGGYYNSSSPFTQTLMPNEEPAPSKVTDLYGAARTQFIQRVYTVLGAQLLFTVFMTALSMYNLAFFKFQIENPLLVFLALIVCIVIQIWMFCCQGGRKYPTNIILTVLFTVCESYIVSFICSITGMQSGNSIVLIAAFMTLAVVAACTAYAIYSKQDYTASNSIIVVLTVVMLCIFVILMFTDSPFLQALYCGLGVLLFGIYIVIDTQMIMGGKSVELEIDEYYFGALLLYIDIISIFLYILQLLGMVNSSNSN